MFTVDTNLIAFVTPRRFLMGMAAYLSDPIFLAPTVASETKRRILESTMDYIVGKDATPQGDMSVEYIEQCGKLVQYAVDLFVDKDLPAAKGIFISQDVNIYRAAVVRKQIPDEIFTIGIPIRENRDKRIAVETIASDVYSMVTSNMGSINHTLFNEWGREKYGLNQNFIYTPDTFVQNTFGHKFREAAHQIAINMTLSHRMRSDAENRRSLDNFIKNLKPWMPSCSNVIDLEERDSPSRNLRWEHGQELIKEELWATARAVEDKREGRKSSASEANSCF